MKHCKRFFSFLAALALLLSLSLPSLSMAESGQAEDGARSPVEASVEHAAEDADLWDDAESWGDGDEAPAPEYPALQEDADAADAANDAPAPAFPEELDEAIETEAAPVQEDGALSEAAEPRGDAENADGEAPDLEFPAQTDGIAAWEDADFVGEAAPVEFPAQTDGIAAWEDADFIGEAAPVEFPGLEEEADEAESPAAHGALRFTADTHRGFSDNLHVAVEADLDALPEGAVLCVEAVTDENVLDAVADAEQTLEHRVSLVRALRIAFFDRQGRPLQPRTPVRVTLSSQEVGAAEELRLVRAEAETPEGGEPAFARVETLEAESDAQEAPAEVELLAFDPDVGDALPSPMAAQRQSQTAELHFELDASGVYAIVGLETVVFEYLSADGETCTVTVSYDPERFAFLRDASLSVRELEGAELEACLEAAAQELGTDSAQLFEAVFLDIQLCAPDGTAYHELGGDVRVSIRGGTSFAPEPGTTRYAVHFADGPDAAPQLSEATLSEDGTEICFAQNGFSITGTVLQIDDPWPLYRSSYVVLVREPNADPDDPYYMLVDTDETKTVEETTNGITATYTRSRVKLEPAPVEKAEDGSLTLRFEDDPDKGVIYDDVNDISHYLWYFRNDVYKDLYPKNNASGKSLKNMATGRYLGPGMVTSRKIQPAEAMYCAVNAEASGEDYTVKAAQLGFSSHAGYPRRMASQNKNISSDYRYWWYFARTEDSYLKGIRSPYGSTNLSDAPPDSALEFYFVWDIQINGQIPMAEKHQIEGNPYYFHTYADNPQTEEPPLDIRADPPAAEKTLTARGDGSYALSLSVTAATQADSFTEGSAEVVLVVDVSGSMYTDGAATKEMEALYKVGNLLMDKNVPIHLVFFARGAWTDFRTYTNSEKDDYRAMLSHLSSWARDAGDSSIYSSTNWEAGLALGAEVLDRIELKERCARIGYAKETLQASLGRDPTYEELYAETGLDQEAIQRAEMYAQEYGGVDPSENPYKDKYVFFISDGLPNYYLNPTATITSFSYWKNEGWGYYSAKYATETNAIEEDDDNNSKRLDHPMNLARRLVDGGANFISLYIHQNGDDLQESAARMKILAAHANSGTVYSEIPLLGTYYEAEASADKGIAGELISAARFILRQFFYQDVSLTDGLTEGTALAGTTGLAPAGAVPDFSYRITHPIKNASGQIVEIREYTGEEVEGETLIRFRLVQEGESEPARYLGVADPTEDVTQALLFCPADFKNGTVSWDIQTSPASGSYRLLDGATYTVSFPVWPNQAAYDAIAGTKNGVTGTNRPGGLSQTEEYNYSIKGDAPVLLSELFLWLNIEKPLTDVGTVVSSDETLLSVTKDLESGNWMLARLQELDTPQTLTITMKNGDGITVHVTSSEEYNYCINGDAPFWLSELFTLLHIEKQPTDVDTVVSSDETLLSVTQDSESDEWGLARLQEFDTPQTLTITMKNGDVITVHVTSSAEDWMLSTNTKAEMRYTPVLLYQDSDANAPEWRVGTSAQSPIRNPEPVELVEWNVGIRKVWKDAGFEHEDIESITLHLLQDGKEYGEKIVLTKKGGWYSAAFYLSPAMMVSKTDENKDWGQAVKYQGKDYVLLNKGHSYSFREEEITGALYQFELEKETFYPVLVDGEPVNAQRNGNVFTNVGRLEKTLLANNKLANAISIEITKQVLDAAGQPFVPQENGEDAKADAKFHLTVTLTAPDGDLSGFPLLNGDRIVRFGVLDRKGISRTAERFKGNNYLVFDNEGKAERKFTIGAGETIVFPSVPENTRYTVQEPEGTMPEGYVLQGIACTVRDPDTAAVTAAIQEADGSYLAKHDENRVVVTNQLRVEEEVSYPPRIVIDKFQNGDNSQKLSGASFVLYRFPSPEKLEENPALSAETPLYYSRAADSAPPEFQPNLDLALVVTTDANGFAEFTDLSDGVYYLLETEAPVDYRKLVAPIPVTVDTSWLETAVNPTQAQIAAASVFTVHIANTPKTTLPATGGPGPARQAGLAPLLLGVGAAGLVILRRKRKTAGR